MSGYYWAIMALIPHSLEARTPRMKLSTVGERAPREWVVTIVLRA